MASTNISMLRKTSNNIYSDECYTPYEAVKPLMEFLTRDKVYYECTSALSGSIVSIMGQCGYNILPSNGRDFLNDVILEKVDAIITNPPYSKKDKFIKKCYELNLPFALLLPVSSIQGQTRG